MEVSPPGKISVLQKSANQCRIFGQMAQALAMLHYGFDYRHPHRDPPKGWRRVVHRDIKPNNIFLTSKIQSRQAPFPDVVLGDFGFATDNPQTDCVAVPQYSPPELPIASAKGDVWSLGAVIHKLTVGRVPIGDKPRGLRMSFDRWLETPEARQPRGMPSRYSKNLNDMMMGCLLRDPEDRWDSKKLLRLLTCHYPHP